MPGSTLLFGVIATVAGQLWAAALARGVEAATANSLFRSAYELLYTPLPAREKRAGKSVIDVAATRIGDAAGSVVVLLIVALAPVWAPRVSMIAAAVGSAGVALLAAALHRGYVAALADALRSGVVQIDPRDVHDATTQRTLIETSVMLDRDRLLAAIGKLHGEGRPGLEEALPNAAAHVTETAVLLHRLEAKPLDETIAVALEKLAPEATGQIADAMLDASLPTSMRRQLPRILIHGEPRRAALAMWVALDDPDVELRHQCGRALLELRVTQKTEIEIARRRIVDTAVRDLTTTPDHADIEHALTLLALVYDPEGLRLATRALFTSDPQVRGTALEYLESVLPSEAHRAVKRGLS